MAAHLYPGIKSLHLVLDTPYDTIRTSDIRDDIAGVKVWTSLTSGFDPQLGQGTLVFDGLSLLVTIPNLTTNTKYYVKYAFVSAIEPEVYTISSELFATVYDENVTVYGDLTNSPISIPTKADGTGGTYTQATGTFRVFDLSQEVTGAGPVYGIAPGTTQGALTASINAVTGVYVITDMLSNTGSITFTADYNNNTIQKVCVVSKSLAGANARSLRISATADSFIFKDSNATTSTSTTISLNTQLQNLTGTPTYSATAYTREGTSLGVIAFTQSGSSIAISAAQFNPDAYNNTVGYVTVVSTLDTISDTITLYRLNDGSEQITVEQSNQTHVISADSLGVISSYSGSGNTIKVFQGSNYLPVDNSSPYPNGSWRITTITGVGITASTTPTIGIDYVTFSQHASMTTDTAYIDYEITGISTTGKSFVIVVRQSFAKSKAGTDGLPGADGAPGAVGTPGPAVDISGVGSIYKNSGGAYTPVNVTLTALLANITSPSYSWEITGATPSTGSGSSVILTPASGYSSITVKLTLTGSNITAPLSITKYIAIVEQGTAGQAGQNGVMSGYPTIYQWATSTPARPSTTSTYTWATGAYTPPSGWSNIAPNNTTPGYILYEITIPLTVIATVTTSTLDWTNTNYSIRATTINGTNGSNGANGANGANGNDGANGSATYLITRSANDSSQPTASEVYAATGNKRYAVIGDIATINYNSGNNSVAYRATGAGYSASWSLQSSYITGSLIVQNSISGDRIIANTLSANKITSGTTSTINSTAGTFSLGDQQFLVFPTTAAFTANGDQKWALVGYNYGTSGFCQGVGGGSSSDSGLGVVGYNANNISATNFTSVGYLGGRNLGVYGRNQKPSSIGAFNNLSYINTEFMGGNSGYGATATGNYAGLYTTTNKNQVLLAPAGEGSATTQDFCGAFTRFYGSGVTQTQVFLATGNYAVQAVTGQIYSFSGFAPFTGSHTGVLESIAGIEIGDILVDSELLTKESVSATLLKQSLSSVPNQKTVFGVYVGIETNTQVHNDGVIARPSTSGETVEDIIVKGTPPPESYKLTGTQEFVSINSLGEGQVNVCGEGGSIEMGDLITTSSIPGKGMRQADDMLRSYTVAKARESVTFNSPTEVKMIACTYHCG